MLRRVAPLLLALVVGGAPVALELCHIACVSLASQSGAHDAAYRHMSHTASCHDAAESPAPLSLHAQPCGHGGDLPTLAGMGSDRGSRFGRSLAAAIPAAGGIATTPQRTHTTPRSGPSDRSAIHLDLTLPLRI